MSTSKLHSNVPLYINTVTDRYTGRWWIDCYIWCSEEGPGWAAASPIPVLAAQDVTVHPSTASALISYYFMWHYNDGWQFSVVVTRWFRSTWLPYSYMLRPVSAWMGDCLRSGKLSRYVTSHPQVNSAWPYLCG